MRMMMYWHPGERIFIEEQRGQDRAAYGEYLIRNLARQIEAEFGSGEVHPQLIWSQYRQLISIDDNYKREYMNLKQPTMAGHELERQIKSQLYERLLLSNDKESVLAVARNRPACRKLMSNLPIVIACLTLQAKATLLIFSQ